MRACEGCRRRKIKCDAATTNTWPCAACTRLKLHCVPPSGDRDQVGSAPSSDGEGPIEYDAAASHLDQPPLQISTSVSQMQHHTEAVYSSESCYPGPDTYSHHDFDYSTASSNVPYQQITPKPSGSTASHGHIQSGAQRSLSHPGVLRSASQKSLQDDFAAALGELKIDENGIGERPKRVKCRPSTNS